MQAIALKLSNVAVSIDTKVDFADAIKLKSLTSRGPQQNDRLFTMVAKLPHRTSMLETPFSLVTVTLRSNTSAMSESWEMTKMVPRTPRSE